MLFINCKTADNAERIKIQNMQIMKIMQIIQSMQNILNSSGNKET